MGRLDVFVSGQTANCALVFDDMGQISVRFWQYSDGTRISEGTTSSHLFTTYGNQSVSVAFWYLGKQLTWSRSFVINNPGGGDVTVSGFVVENVFKSKPMVIPAECTGDITLYASIEDLNVPGDTSQNVDYSSNIGYAINFGTIIIPGNTQLALPFDQYTNTESTFVDSTTTVVTDAENIKNVGYIPAFYNQGSATIQYSIIDTDDDNSAFDVIWDLWMEFPTLETQVPWMEGNFATSSQIFKNMIHSSNSEANFAEIAEYSIDTKQFTIDKWTGVPPFIIKEFIDEPATTIMIKRAMLADPKFYLVAKNELSNSVTLGFVLVTFSWNFNIYDPLMNMSPSWTSRQKHAKIYTLPKGAENTRRTGLDFPLYAVIDGYERFTTGKPDEIVKVYAQWDEYYEDETDGYLFPTFVQLAPVPDMYGTDYPTCIYKSGVLKNTGSFPTIVPSYPLKHDDFVRISSETGWESNDKIIVIDAPSIAAEEMYRTINVSIKDGNSPDSSFATFIIKTMPNDSLNFATITVDDLTTNVKKLHFFNHTCNFATYVEVTRNRIDPIFYETLWQTYDKSVVLESISEEPLNYVLFSVNDYPTFVPIYDGGSVKFSDNLTHAVDGVRSSKIFHMDGVTQNTINMRLPTKHKYKVKFQYPYEVYKDIYVVTDDDFPTGFKPE